MKPHTWAALVGIGLVGACSSVAEASPSWACCYDDPALGWACLNLEDYKCEDLGGTWYLGLLCGDPAIDCDPTPVDGACCIEKGQPGSGAWYCVEITQAECVANSGVWFGIGSLCSDPGVNCGLPTGDCISEPGALCAGRSRFQAPEYQVFGGGPIGVQTASPSIMGGTTVMVFDLTNINAAPVDSWFQLNRYADPSWNQYTLGSVFGLALDSEGNIYVSASKMWNGDYPGVGGWGAVYRIDTLTSAITVFAQLPNPGNASLGSLTFDCQHNQFFVSNFDDGLVYRLDNSGAVLDTFDHGTPWNGGAGPVPLGDRPWAVEVHAGRLFYSMWNESAWNGTTATANEVWSIALGAQGEPIVGSEQLEVSVSALQYDASSPVSDIRFSQGGDMFIAERSNNAAGALGAHTARVLKYECEDSEWVDSLDTYEVGLPVYAPSATGGVDVTLSHVWAGADAMHYGMNDMLYGLQALPITGGSVINSILIDYQDVLNQTDKMMLGDVVVAGFQGASEVDCPFVQPLSVECANAMPPHDYTLTVGVSNMDPVGVITAVDLSPPASMTATPSHIPMSIDPQHSWAFDTLLAGGTPGTTVCIDMVVTFASGATCDDSVCFDLGYCSWIPGDFDFNAMVNVDDLMILIGWWGTTCDRGIKQDCNLIDVDESGSVDMGDLLIVLDNWTVG